MSLDYPNDADGGGRRTATIANLSKKIAMVESDLSNGIGDATDLKQRLERYKQQLATAQDPSNPL